MAPAGEGGNTSLIFFHKILLPFSPFPGGAENTQSDISQTSTNSRTVYGL